LILKEFLETLNLKAAQFPSVTASKPSFFKTPLNIHASLDKTEMLMVIDTVTDLGF